MFRARLSADGRTTIGDVVAHFKTKNRYRDITISPDNRAFYVITDSEGPTSGPSGGATQQLANPGSILEFEYTGAE